MAKGIAGLLSTIVPSPTSKLGRSVIKIATEGLWKGLAGAALHSYVAARVKSLGVPGVQSLLRNARNMVDAISEFKTWGDRRTHTISHLPIQPSYFKGKGKDIRFRYEFRVGFIQPGMKEPVYRTFLAFSSKPLSKEEILQRLQQREKSKYPTGTGLFPEGEGLESFTPDVSLHSIYRRN